MEGLRAHRLLLEHEPAGNGTRTRSSEADFDANMVIVLAALLFALICALGLNSIVRCALRCGRRLSPESPDDAAASLAATGLKRSALRRIPVAVYGSGTDIPATECPICLGDFAAGDKVRVLPTCRHGFHVGCIDTWLLSRSSCPTCRRSLLEPPPPACSGSDDGGGGVRQHTAPEHGGDVPVMSVEEGG